MRRRARGPRERGHRHGTEDPQPAPLLEAGERPDRAAPGGRRRPGSPRPRGAPPPRRAGCRSPGRFCPWKTFQVRTTSRIARPHTLGACASSSSIRLRSRCPTTTTSPPLWPRAALDVELVTSRFRFGDAPAPQGYARRELFYPASSRLSSPLAAAAAASRRPSTSAGLARLRRLPRDVLHVQWAPLPQVDVRLLPAGRAVGDHRPRHPPAPDADADGALAAPLRALRPGRRPQRGRTAGGSSRRSASSRSAISGNPPPRLPGCVALRGRRGDAALLRSDPAVQADRPRARGRARGSVRACSSWATRRFELGERLRRPGVEWRLGYQPDAEIARALASVHCRAVSVPAGARPERGASARARRRGRCCLLRRGRDRRARASASARASSRRRTTSTRSSRACAACS